MTAGTIMHRSHLPLKTWFMAVHIVTSHSNGISALQLQAPARARPMLTKRRDWLLLHKLRRAMVDPDRSLLEDLVEIDEATLPFRTVKDPTAGGQGRSPQGKMRIAGAVELSPEGEPRRIRLAPIGDFSARSLHAFVAGTSAPGARVITDGWSGYCGLPDHNHQPKVVGATSSSISCQRGTSCAHRLKCGAGTFHRSTAHHLRRYLDEFVFRWNRRFYTRQRPSTPNFCGASASSDRRVRQDYCVFVGPTTDLASGRQPSARSTKAAWQSVEPSSSGSSHLRIKPA